ncbi:MAG: ChaB family protein [Actinomycetota bacterium]|nr:ChaB family protein [Actinomycetota bacterium]
MPGKEELPETLKRSPAKAQRTWAKAHDSAVDTYGEGERAHRTAFAALKHSWEKVDDRWEPKRKKGPSDPRAKQPTEKAAQGKGETYGGVDVYGNSKHALYERAKDLGIKGRSRMSKEELARAIAKKQR